MKDILGIILAMALCGLIIWLAYRFSRMFALRMGGRLGSKYLKEIERMAMGTESYITLLQCGSKYYLAGVTKQGISLLAEIDEDSLTELPIEAAGSQGIKLTNIKESAFYQKLSSSLGDIKNRKNSR